MRLLRVINTRHNRELGARIGLADGWFARLRGMMAGPAPAAGEGLLLTPCRSVHMFGMSFPLDVAFLDVEGAVVATYGSLSPWSRTRWHRNAVHALELPAGTLENSGTVIGDVLVWSSESVSSASEQDRRTEAVS
ncbi:MAG TPA: DUF192 domain-containing protein [Gemmatimonadales bacterium]|nr:DUF192 domain-containing protein [Gemmatimonadales bacterium]